MPTVAFQILAQYESYPTQFVSNKGEGIFKFYATVTAETAGY